MRRLLRWLILLPLFGLTVAYAGVVGAMLVERRDLIYRFDRWPTSVEDVRAPGRLERIAGADGTEIALWVVEPEPGRPVALHFGGNLGVFRRTVDRTRALIDAGYGVVAMNYRGASGAPGAPSQEAIVADALATYDALPALGLGDAPPVVYGTSLGAAVAVQLAARRPVAATVLAAPFARLCSVAEHHYPWLIACAVMWDERWDSVERIDEVGSPLLILHGEEDRIIPVDEARRLHAAAEAPKRLVLYPGAGHRNLAWHGAEDEILAWLERVTGGARPGG